MFFTQVYKILLVINLRQTRQYCEKKTVLREKEEENGPRKRKKRGTRKIKPLRERKKSGSRKKSGPRKKKVVREKENGSRTPISMSKKILSCLACHTPQTKQYCEKKTTTYRCWKKHVLIIVSTTAEAE